MRIYWYLSYFWRITTWIFYGYETLNDRLIDPSRQNQQMTLFVQLRHLFNDWSGLNVGITRAQFFEETPEIFNQSYTTVSLHTYWRF